MFLATMYSSSGGQLCEYNIWYNHSVLVAIRYRTLLIVVWMARPRPTALLPPTLQW